MTDKPTELEGKLVLSGTLVFADAQGEVVKTVDFESEIRLAPEPQQPQEQPDDDQRSQ